MTVTTVRLQPDTQAGLESMADRLNRSKNWLINQAIREFLARQEVDQERWAQTQAAIEAAANGKTVPGRAVHQWLRSWGKPGELESPDTDS